MDIGGLELSPGEMVLIAGLLVKFGAELYRNKQQDEKLSKHIDRLETVDRKVDRLSSYVTNGVDAPGGGLSSKFMTRGECALAQQAGAHHHHTDPEQ